jgi:exonuclease III
MKAISFNVNSIRMRLSHLEAVIETHSPDFIGLQETKVNDPDFPIADIAKLGYEFAFHGQKTHYGVALLSRYPFKATLNRRSAVLSAVPSIHRMAKSPFLTVIFHKVKAATIR